jgi:hypothetical protein
MELARCYIARQKKPNSILRSTTLSSTPTARLRPISTSQTEDRVPADLVYTNTSTIYRHYVVQFTRVLAPGRKLLQRAVLLMPTRFC